MREIRITKNEDNQRLDKFLEKYLPKAPKSLIQKLLRKKRIKLNGKKADPSDLIFENDRLNFYIYEEDLTQWEDDNKEFKSFIDLDIVYEDENIVVVDKPKNVLSHAVDKEDYGKNVVDWLIDYLIYKEEYIPRLEKTFKPAIVNRLDRNTEGLIIGAKNRRSLVYLNEIINSDLIEKNYLALVHGRLDKELVVENKLSKDEKNVVRIGEEGKDSRSIVSPIYSSANYSLVKIRLITGRTHQIRVHLASLGHPIVGDNKYGDRKKDRDLRDIKDQQLLAYELKFGQVELESLKNKTIESPKSKDMIELYNKLQEE